MENLAKKVSNSKFVVTLTGAGVSAESGISTFRDKDGLWKTYRVDELATPNAFARNPKLVWEWYEWRRNIIRNASPNPAHYAIAKLERTLQNFLLITQNVDNLHKVAGSEKIIELHGNIFKNKCSRCGKIYDATKGPVPLGQSLENLQCDCGGLLRPDVVWFGESIPHIEAAFNASSTCDFMLVVGTSGTVEPAASLPYIAKRAGAFILEINLNETPLTQVADYSIFGKAGEILPTLVQNLLTVQKFKV
ncbi:MAG: NAD-dependent deacylase [bacterium]|nr:NAD-dependent deacylase [bacterium]